MKTPFWRGVFSEPDGTPSFARIGTGAFVLCAIGWITFLVCKNHSIPDIGGIAVVIASIYGINKVTAAFGK